VQIFVRNDVTAFNEYKRENLKPRVYNSTHRCSFEFYNFYSTQYTIFYIIYVIRATCN